MRLFICADDNDDIQLERLTDVLDGYRMTVDIDRMINVRRDSRPALQAAIQDCDAFVFALTARSLANPRCRWEFRQAEQFRRPIVTVLLEPIDPVPRAFHPHLITDLTADDGPENLLDALYLVGATPPSMLAQLFRNRVALLITVLLGFLLAWSLAGPRSPVRQQVTETLIGILDIANRTESSGPPPAPQDPPANSLLDRSADAAAIFRSGQELARNGDYAAAIDAYNRTLDITPGAVGAYIARGNAAYELGQVQTARADFSRAIDLAPGLALPYLSRAAFYVRVREPRAALADVDAALAIEPSSAEAYNLRGEAYFVLGEMNAALTAYDRALDLQPDNARAHSNRGQVHRYAGRLKLARADFDRAIQLNPLLADAFTRRGDLLVSQNNPAALDDYTRALRLNPADPNARYGRGTLLAAQGDYRRAAGDFSRAIARLPADANLFLQRGTAYRCAGEPTLAVTDFTSAAELDLDRAAAHLRQPATYACVGGTPPPVDPNRIGATDANLDGIYQFIAEAFAARAAARAAENDLAAAIAAYTQAITFTPSYTEVATLQQQRGDLYQQRGQLDAALSDYQQAARIQPTAAVYVRLGRVQAQTGNPDAALTQFTRAIAQDPLSIDAYLARAAVYQSQDAPEQALDAYTRAAYIQPDNPDVLTRKARLLLQLERCPLAAADVDALAVAAPQHPALPSLQATLEQACPPS